jgi:hypothetical protein
MGWWYWAKTVPPPQDVVRDSFFMVRLQWQYCVALALFAVLAVFVCKRLAARLVAGLLSRDGLDVKIEVVGIAKIKKLDLKLRTKVLDIRIRAKELSIDRVKLVKTISEACVGKFRDNSFKIPVRITGLRVGLEKTHEAVVGEEEEDSSNAEVIAAAEGRRNPAMGYYTLYLSRIAIFLASLFRVDADSLALKVSHAEKCAQVDMDQICISSQQSNPILSIQTLSLKLLLCSEEKDDVVLCESRVDGLCVKASNLEHLPTVLKYSEVDVSVNTVDFAHTTQYEIVAPLLDTNNSKQQLVAEKDGNSQASALMMYAPSHLSLALSKASMGTLGAKSKDPTHRLLIVTLSVTLTHKGSVEGVPKLFGSSNSNFKYTWRLLVTSSRIEMQLQHALSEMCSVKFKDLKSITTSVCAGQETQKLVQNVVLNFDCVQARTRPLEEKSLRAMEQILKKLDWKGGRSKDEEEAPPSSSPNSSLDVQLAINSVGFSLESPNHGMLFAKAPNVSIKLRKKAEAFLSQIYCKTLCASITKEKYDSFSTTEWDTASTTCTQDFITIGKLKVATDFSEAEQKGFVLDTDLGITGCKMELTQESLAVADIFDEYACPWISIFRSQETRKSTASTTVNFHLQGSDVSLQYLAMHSKAMLCRVDALSFSTIQQNVSNLYVKTCTVCMASKPASLTDAEGFESVHLMSIQDVTLTESSLMSDEGLRAAYKIWCTKIKVEADYNSFEFLLNFTDGVSKDVGYISSLQTFEHCFSAEKSTSIDPIFDVEMRKVDIMLSGDNTDWKLSIRKLIMREEYKYCSNSIRLSVEGEEILRVNGLDLEVIQDGSLESKSAENGYEIALAIKQAHGRLPDQIQIGDSFLKLASVCEKLQRDLQSVFEIDRSDANIGCKYSVSLSILEWDIEVENSKFETWLASHKVLLQECHYGIHLLDDIKSESNISVFDYFSPVKEGKPKPVEKEKDNHYLYDRFMRSYIRGCKQIDSNTSLFKNVLRCKGNGIDAKFRLDAIQQEDISQALQDLEGSKAIVKCNTYFVLDFSVEFKEIFAHLCSMNDPFLHARKLQVAFAKLKNLDELHSLCGKDHDCASAGFQFFGDVLIQIDNCKGMYGVAMEPYFAAIGREVERLSPTRGTEQKRSTLLEQINEHFFGELQFCLRSLEGLLLAEPQLPGNVENQNCFHVYLEDFEVAPSKDHLGVSCNNFQVGASYKFHIGDTLESYLEYERIPIFKSPVFQFGLSLVWKGHQTAGREGDLDKPEKCPNPRKNTIDVTILFKEDNEGEECPIIFVGTKQIKALADIICALKDPPDVLRDSVDRKPFGRFKGDQKLSSKFVKMLDGLNFQIESRPLKLRYWDELPNAPGHTATIDVEHYTLDMVFCYTDLCKKYENAKLRRIPKLKEIRIYGKDIVFSAKDDNSGNLKEEVTSSQVEEKIATLLGNPVGLKSGLEDKMSLVMQVQSIVVSNKKSEEELLSRTPFQIEISHPKALLDTLKRDVLYTCIASVANGIGDVLNEHKGEDSQFRPAGAAGAVQEEENSSEEVKEAVSGKEAPQDLLSILLQSQRGQLPASSGSQKEEPGSMQIDLDFIIEAIQPQVNFESESANGRFLLSSEKALVKVYKTFTNEGLCIRQKSEILLKSIQMHVCQLDVDPNAAVQWLLPDSSGELVSPNESVLHSVFDPCSVSLNLFQEGEFFEIDIDLASITLALDSREFEILADIISRVALSPFPRAPKKVSLSLLGSDMLRITKLDRFASMDQLETFKTLNRKAFEELNNMMYVLTISKRQEEFTSGTDTGICCPEALFLKDQLKESMKLALKEKKNLVGDLLQLEKKAKSQATTINKQTKVSLKLNTVRWSLCKDRKVFLEATLQDCNFSRVRYEDFSGITRFQIGDATCNASIVDKDSELSQYEVLRLWNPSKKYDSVPFLHIYLVASGESHGLSMFELCDITLHPLDIHLAQKTASELQKYFFNRTLSQDERHMLWSHIGSPLPRDKSADSSVKESEPVHVEEAQASSAVSTPKLSHKHSVSWDLRAFPNLDDLESEHKHKRSISTDLNKTWKTATEYLLEEDEEKDDSSGGILDILNHSFPLSPTEEGKLARQNSFEAERGIALDKLRMNELGLRLSFESKVLNVTDMKLYLDTFDYLRYNGTWQELMEKVKWNIIKSVLKNMAGFQTGKIRGFTSSMNPRAILKKKKKSIFKSLFFTKEGKDPEEDNKSQATTEPGETSAATKQTTEEEQKANPEYYEEKGKLLLGNRYTKNV